MEELLRGEIKFVHGFDFSESAMEDKLRKELSRRHTQLNCIVQQEQHYKLKLMHMMGQGMHTAKHDGSEYAYS